jgi:hypothetical protein
MPIHDLFSAVMQFIAVLMWLNMCGALLTRADVLVIMYFKELSQLFS